MADNDTAAGAAAHADIAGMTFEQAQAELERVVERLEDQGTGLDEAIELWERGEALHAFCQAKLDYAAQRIERLKVSPEEVAAVVAESGDDFAPSPPAAAPVAPASTPPAVAAPAGEDAEGRLPF